MTGHWLRHRFFTTLIMSAAVSAIIILLFVYPYIRQTATSYNDQSVYNNSDIDFIAPEPSFEQVQNLPGTNGVSKIFPFFLTKTEIECKDKTRTSTVLLSDDFQNIDITMYSKTRLIKKSSSEVENPIWVDWQFSRDTGCDIGDKVSLSISGNKVDFTICAIYETNCIYDGGAIIAQISKEQANLIKENSSNNGYSGMYVTASDYATCKQYLETEYRPLGRLKNREQFDDDEQYQLHYDAIMSSGYSNEITDFTIRKNEMTKEDNYMLIIAGAILGLIIVLAFNTLMSKRGCEKGYFAKNCIPKGQNVKPYYTVSFFGELILIAAFSVGMLYMKLHNSDIYIPKSAWSIKIMVIPCAMLLAEVVALVSNKVRLIALGRKAQ